MAQLDRFLSVMISNQAESIQLVESDVASLVKDGALRPMTRQPLTQQQLLGLLREIAPERFAEQLAEGTPTSFHYANGDGRFAITTAITDGLWHASIAQAMNGEGPSVPGGAAMGSGELGMAAEPAMHAIPAEQPRASRNGNHAGENGNHAGVEQGGTALASMDQLLRVLIEKQASDLHLRTGEAPVLRIHGEMARLDGFAPIQEEQMEGMLNSIMPPRNKQEYADLNDTDFAYEIEGLARFRCNALRDRKGAGAVFRSIPSSVVSVEQLGLSQEVQNLCYMSKGLVLVTGPTGSGKSTTLGAMMDLINRVRPDHVITIEDPIEFVHHNKRCMITQRQVGQHTQSFKAALRAALREDPDIILVGELRDLETVSIAIETAETGHLVFGTLHTTTAASTVDRIIDQFPADRQEQIRVMLSESLKGVIAQTLCRKIGGGRVAAREILLSIPAIANLIREGKTFQIPSVIQTSRKLGMVTLNDALFELVDSRQVEPREAYIKAHDKSGLVLMFKNRGLDVGFAEAEDVPGGGGAPPPKGAPRAEFKGPTAPPPVASRPRK
jgi:twitching motility protein PilT